MYFSSSCNKFLPTKATPNWFVGHQISRINFFQYKKNNFLFEICLPPASLKKCQNLFVWEGIFPSYRTQIAAVYQNCKCFTSYNRCKLQNLGSRYIRTVDPTFIGRFRNILAYFVISRKQFRFFLISIVNGSILRIP